MTFIQGALTFICNDVIQYHIMTEKKKGLKSLGAFLYIQIESVHIHVSLVIDYRIIKGLANSCWIDKKELKKKIYKQSERIS